MACVQINSQDFLFIYAQLWNKNIVEEKKTGKGCKVFHSGTGWFTFQQDTHKHPLKTTIAWLRSKHIHVLE